jgi:acetylornithine deacetylase
VSAIAKMARVVTALDDLDRNVLRSRVGALVGPASMHCGRIEGGIGLSTYAPSCEIRLERRYLPEERESDVIEEIRGTVLAADPSAEIEILLARPALSCPADSAIARCVRDASRAVRGGAPKDAGVAFWMDAAVFASAGIPTVDYGPSGAGAHEDDEWVSLASITDCARVYHRAAIEFAKARSMAGGPGAI